MDDADDRPDPEMLLKKLQASEVPSRGRLRVYLGAAPGVGKTYAMLNEGRRRAERGTDVVIGMVETYDRPLTVEAAEGIELLPRRRVEYRGVTLEEMDLESLLQRRPQVALVDELAHTNAPGSTNEKRWQDVEALRDAGITVISTVNVQHLESLNDVVAGITGVRVRETVPDWVIDGADEVEVVDISPEALQARMRHGNIYPPDQARQALDGFFRKGNLAALRELALKRVALEVEQKLHEYMNEHRLEGWTAGERVLVLLDPSPEAETALRRAWRLAHALNGELIAAYSAGDSRQQGMIHALTVALDLNATLREMPGDDPVSEISSLIASEGVTHVTVLRQPSTRTAFMARPSVADRLLIRHPHLEIHLVRA